MLHTYIHNTQLIAWTVMFLMGFYLLYGNISSKHSLTQYYKARKLLGIAYLIIGIQFLLQWFFRPRLVAPDIAAALNITFFFFSGTLVGYSYISLLDNKFLQKKRMIGDAIICIVASITIWASIALLPERIISIVLKLGAVAMFLYIGRMGVDFIRTYRRSVKMLNNYYSDDTSIFIRWMSKSVFLKIATGILCPIMTFFTEWSFAIYLTINVILFYYIFCCYLSYLNSTVLVNSAIEPETEKDVDDSGSKTLTIEQKNNIDKHLKEWIEKGGYLEQGVTINALSVTVGINKTYLSRFINTELNTTFRDWINIQRIKYAQEIMLESPHKVNDEIAEMTGYTSRSHFIKVFTSISGQPPATWKSNQLNALKIKSM
ncbi:MAG: helix-turn-helix domain-containing protein [Marinifilaceae bacterium]